MKGGWDRACQSRVTVAGTTFKPHLAVCPLPGPGFRGPLSASSTSLSRICKGLWRPLLWRGSQGEGGREGGKIQDATFSFHSETVPMATLAHEAPWVVLLHETLKMTLGQPCCSSSHPSLEGMQWSCLPLEYVGPV